MFADVASTLSDGAADKVVTRQEFMVALEEYGLAVSMTDRALRDGGDVQGALIAESAARRRMMGLFDAR